MNPNQNYQPHDNRYPNCSACRNPMQPLMQMPVRVGGSQGAALFFFNGLSEINERVLTLDVYRCPNCRRLEFFDLDMSLPNK